MPRGGWRQRAGERSRSPLRGAAMSQQLQTWLSSWAWGGHSAADLVRNAQAFVRDGHRDPLIEQLARGGGSIGNAERAVRRLLPTEEGPRTVEVSGGGDAPIIIPPATMFHWVFILPNPNSKERSIEIAVATRVNCATECAGSPTIVGCKFHALD
eukprot:5229174-Alexandrium_andersonii.AAC.1